MNRIIITLAVLLALSTIAVSPVVAQISAAPTLVNFQGRLATPAGNLVPDGTYSIRFSLWDAVSAGTEKWNQTLATVQVRNGTFAVPLNTNTANLFNGNLWLEIKVGTDAALTPRQQIVTVPYAFKANSVADGSITSASIANGTLNIADFPANFFNPLAWLLGGNSATNPAANFLGTTDNQPLDLRVNNRRAMRYQYAENTAIAGGEYRSINVLGGSELNSIGAGVVGATIAGGGYGSFTGTDFPNRVTANFGTVGGGAYNTVSGESATVAGGSNNFARLAYSTIAGGESNTASGDSATVGGGYSNTASQRYATVGGGYRNTASGDYATVGGGTNNTASVFSATVGGGFGNTASDYATVSGGRSNTASGQYATVGGGYQNIASGQYATVAGGFSNLASGFASTVPGGNDNTASGQDSFAAGRRARANHDGAFVWGDSTNADFASTAINQFLIRANGGVGINTTNPGSFDLYVAGTTRTASLTVSGTLTVTNIPLGDYRNVQVNGATGQFYYDNSSRKHKRNITPLVDDFDKLLKAVPMTYTRPNAPGRWEIGFIAEDFDALGLKKLVDYGEGGEVEGINYEKICLYLTAIARKQGDRLTAQEQKHSAEVNTLKAENADLCAELNLLKAAVRELQNNRK